MARPADPLGSRWWIERSGRTVAVLVLGVAAAAWLLMLLLPGMKMPGMGAAMSPMGPAMPAPDGPMTAGTGMSLDWSVPDLAAFTATWALMMAAMMLPSATPTIALYRVVAQRRDPEHAARQTVVFALPYAALWTLTGLPVYACSVWIDALVRAHPWARTASPYAAAAILLLAGTYQFTPLKRTCLTNCRNPLRFLVAHWRGGSAGALRIGSLHAAYCAGCCVLLMIVLVAAGAMGLAWVLLIAAAVALEKLAPTSLTAPRVAGIALVALGAAVLLSPHVATELRS